MLIALITNQDVTPLLGSFYTVQAYLMQISANTPWYADKLKPEILKSFVVKKRDLILRNQLFEDVPKFRADGRIKHTTHPGILFSLSYGGGRQ